MSASFTREIATIREKWNDFMEGENCLPEQNLAFVRGKIIEEATFACRKGNQNFYKTTILVQRLSKNEDQIKLVIRADLLDGSMSIGGKRTEIKGEFRSRNIFGKDGKKHLEVFLYAKEIHFMEDWEDENDENLVILDGQLTKEAVMRSTPLGQKIIDLMLSVKKNSKERKYDYIPCIAWGGLAEYLDGAPKGTRLKINGRIQSRVYIKRYPNTDKPDEAKTAYEISTMELEVL